MTDALDGHRESLSLHRRSLTVGGTPVLLDHVLSSRGGAYLIQERPDTTGVDAVRHSAETLESAVSRPVDPVLVLTGPTNGPVGNVRGVLVVPQAAFAGWLAALRQTTSRSEMVLVNARVEKATGDWDHHRRIPDWEARSRLTGDGILASAPAAARRPLSGPVPRAWSPAEGRRVGRPARRRRWRRPDPSRLVMAVVAFLLVMALVGVLTSH